ncbi:MAG: hypothetical protein Q4C72_04110 [Eubacteriales bacterium]|nr:hypothetical protein [Eubacteriales bacterium]
MKEPTCETRQHYRHHFVNLHHKYCCKTRSGHCVYPRSKLRYGAALACAHYRPSQAPQGEQSF